MGNSCLDDFRKGEQERARWPLPSGLYKLREARRRLIDSLALVNEVREFIHSKGAWASPTAPPGAGAALKRLPKSIARELGLNVLPAVEALHGDDLPLSLVNTLARNARAQADALVLGCDRLHASFMRNGIGVECVYIKHDRSVLEQLLTDAVDLIDGVIRGCGAYSEVDDHSAAA